jgi:hypothetical protein
VEPALSIGEPENREIRTPSSDGTPLPPAEGPPLPASPSGPIQWNLFFRLASPLSIVTGVVVSLLLPISVVLILPLCLRRIIARYRPLHSGVLQAGQGARMGAFMAALSFAAFLVFALPAVSLQRAAMLDKFRGIAARNPGPGAQQFAAWVATTEGFIIMVALLLAVVLALFLITGVVSGAMFTRAKKLP